MSRDINVPYPSVKQRYLSPRKALRTLNSFGAQKNNVEELMLKPMKPLLRLIHNAIDQPFRVLGQLFVAQV
jgi:hypothetical protein